MKLIGGWCAEDLTLPSADTVGRRLVACGHNRAIDLYIDSIREDHLPSLLSTKIADSFFLLKGLYQEIDLKRFDKNF